MAAPVTDFNSFAAQLGRQLGEDSEEMVTAHIGRTLTLLPVRATAGAFGFLRISSDFFSVYCELRFRNCRCVCFKQKTVWPASNFKRHYWSRVVV